MLVWHDVKDYAQFRPVLNATDGPIFVAVAAAAQIAGGAALQFRRTAKMGALIAGAVYLVFAALCVPRIIVAPQIYDSWGNFFEPFSLATGAAIIYARRSGAWSGASLARTARMLFGICVASFTLEQAFYLGATASLVPTWLPPSRMFWADATTVAFALAALALLANRMALVATRLLTIMIVMFGLLVWVPLVLSNPQSHTNWSELTETFSIAGAAWILADVLGRTRPAVPLHRTARPQRRRRRRSDDDPAFSSAPLPDRRAGDFAPRPSRGEPRADGFSGAPPRRNCRPAPVGR